MHGIAIAPGLGRDFVSNGQSSRVTIFDLKTLKRIADVTTGKKPDAIIFDPATSRVFAFNGESDSATAIGAATGNVAGTVDLGGGPEYAIADGKGYVFNKLEDEGLVLKIDSRKLTFEQGWSTAPCAKPASLALGSRESPSIRRLPQQSDDSLNADTGQVITTLPIGDQVDATAFDPKTKLIFQLQRRGDRDCDSPGGSGQVLRGRDGEDFAANEDMALDPKTHQLFLSTVESGQFEVLVVGK